MYRKDIGRSLQEKWIVSLRKEWEKRIAAEMSRQAKVGDVPSKKQALLTLERRQEDDPGAFTRPFHSRDGKTSYFLLYKPSTRQVFWASNRRSRLFAWK